MELADKQWAYDNAPEFHVFNAEELASVVYYVNAFSDGSETYSIYIEDDIDLEGYDWKPIGWTDMGNNHCFRGLVDGKGHTINGMRIVEQKAQAGFIGYGLFVEMKDISFTDALVYSEISAGIAGGEIYGTTTWTGVNVQGEVDYQSKLFGFCIQDHKFICTTCAVGHFRNYQKSHKVASLLGLDYLCKEHGINYNSFCKKCNINICETCHKKTHNKHEMIMYKSIYPDQQKLSSAMRKVQDQKIL